MLIRQVGTRRSDSVAGELDGAARPMLGKVHLSVIVITARFKLAQSSRTRVMRNDLTGSFPNFGDGSDGCHPTG